jgi:uncharacterized protein (TIGR04222 family)
MPPFNLPGPQFLLFYLVFGALVLLLIVALRRSAETDQVGKINLSDPCLIACLRGGKNEVLRVVTVSLIDRELLKVKDSKLSAAAPEAAKGVRPGLESDVLSYFDSPKDASLVFSERFFDSAIWRYEEELERLGLLPDDNVKSARWRRLGFALALLGGVAFIKIVLAVSGGHTNIQFLIILTAAFSFAAYAISRPRLTTKGQALLDNLRMLFGNLKDRASSLRPSSSPNELALLAAVYGIGAIPVSAFPYAQKLYPKAASSSGGSFVSSCGSSCGSSSGSSCGGGGCGSGCGGCGGG